MRCFQTEETIYQYLERNNLRLGESIDLRKISEPNPYASLDASMEVRHTAIKEEVEDYGEMPCLVPAAVINNDVVEIENAGRKISQQKSCGANRESEESDSDGNSNDLDSGGNKSDSGSNFSTGEYQELEKYVLLKYYRFLLKF